MKRPKIMPVFNKSQLSELQVRLATKVVQMMGRKFEEGDWTEIYCKVKGIPNSGWSNLQLDIMHENLGVEQKMLCYRSNTDIKDACGQTFMHPSATRSIRIPNNEDNPITVMKSILTQYSDLITQRTNKVIELSGDNAMVPDMRTGWLLWQDSLRQILYFEEEMVKPNPDDYYAEWVKSGGGVRKTSRNLWIYEKETGKKRYSVTTQAGAKIQPYFDVPSPSEKNLYIFTVIGEHLNYGDIRIWLTRTTVEKLNNILHEDINKDTLSYWIIKNTEKIHFKEKSDSDDRDDLAVPFIISSEAYNLLTEKIKGINDDQSLQLLIKHITD